MAIFITALSFKKYSSDERLESLPPTEIFSGKTGSVGGQQIPKDRRPF